jgi:hypothetical protein
MANPDGRRPQFDVVYNKRNIINVVAAQTLKEDDSGSLVSFNIAAGVTVTLPSGAQNGTFYDFVVETTVTSVADKVITGVGTELMVGGILNCDTDTSNATILFPSLVASSNIAVNLNGSTRGGIKGDSFRCTKINSTTWLVEGRVNGTGTVATPFATS